MRKLAVVLIIFAGLLLNCSEDSTGPEETISRPDTPTGDDSANLNETKTYRTGGAVSNLGHTVVYRFDLDAGGAHDYTAWSAFDTVAASWPDTGLYAVKAQARCAEHTDKASAWSESKLVAVAVEYVTPPGVPIGTEFPWPDSIETYCAQGAASVVGHPLEYQFDFDAAGAGDTTAWDTTSCVQHAWPTPGSYEVKVRARCAIHTEVVSSWSEAKTAVVAVESITAPGSPAGETEAYTGEPLTLCAVGAASNKEHQLEYQFEFVGLEVGDSTVWNLADTTAWDTSACATKSWPTIRGYTVRTRARCATHTDHVSQWSGGKNITVTVEQFPEIRFATYIRDAWTPYVHSDVPTDTVGVLEPFGIGYHGITVNGQIQSYKYFPLTVGVVIEGSDVWYNDLVDTTRIFPNDLAELIPSGVLKFAAMCRDDAWAESYVDPSQYRKGVCQIVVNYDPDTRIHGVTSSYTVDDVVYAESINFQDGIPDTVPFDSWARIEYSGWDDARDGKIDCSDLEPDKCIGFQVAYFKDSERIGGATEYSLWQPRDGTHDTDPFSSTDSNTFHIGSVEYDLFARAVDEHGRGDGTPPSIHLVGNFDPVLDSVAVEDHLGNRIDLSTLDTVTWNFSKGEGWPYVCQCDTVDFPENLCDPVDCQGRTYPDNQGTYDFYKVFSVHIKAWGHDHPKDPTGSGVKAWQYLIKNSQDQFVNLGKSNLGWFDGLQVDVLDDVIRWRVRYPDATGDTVFENLPTWLDEDLTVFLMGRDTPLNAGEFYQSLFINGEEQILNVFPTATLGRWTQERVFAFRITLTR